MKENKKPLSERTMEEKILYYFSRVQAVITGSHFVYAKKPDGWFHGSDYVNKDAVYPDVVATSELCRIMVEDLPDCCYDTVVCPTIGGVAISQWIAYWNWELFGIKMNAVYADEEDILEKRVKKYFPGNNASINAVGKVNFFNDSEEVYITLEYFEKVGTRRIIKRGYDKFITGKKCLIGEDVVNSGATVIKTRDAIMALGGEVVGVTAFCNRSGGKVTAETLGVPFLKSLLNVDMKMLPEETCPICKEQGPQSVRTDLGKGKEFLARMGL